MLNEKERIETDIKAEELKFLPTKQSNEVRDTTIRSIYATTCALTAVRYDSENTLFGSEPRFKNLLTDDEAEKAKNKLLELIERL